MKNNFLEKSNKELLEYCLKFYNGPDKKDIMKIAFQAARYYRSSGDKKEQLKEFRDLEKYWYDSLGKRNPAYDVYGRPEFIAETWACFGVYSKGFIKSLIKINLHKFGVNSILDVGCGVGLTTAYLKILFDAENVIGTNVPGYQFNIASKIGEEIGFKIKTNFKNEKNIDLVFASDYFEHFESPIKHLNEVLKVNPKLIVVANSFGSVSVGHFNIYKINRLLVENKRVGRLFNNELKSRGYRQIKTKFYNNRPTIWKKIKGEEFFS